MRAKRFTYKFVLVFPNWPVDALLAALLAAACTAQPHKATTKSISVSQSDVFVYVVKSRGVES